MLALRISGALGCIANQGLWHHTNVELWRRYREARSWDGISCCDPLADRELLHLASVAGLMLFVLSGVSMAFPVRVPAFALALLWMPLAVRFWRLAGNHPIEIAIAVTYGAAFLFAIPGLFPDEEYRKEYPKRPARRRG